MLSWVFKAQALHGLVGAHAPSSSKPFCLSSFSEATPAFLSSHTCLLPLLEHSAYSCQTQGQQRLKSWVGSRAQASFVPLLWLVGHVCLCICVCACVCVRGRVHVCLCTCTVLSIRVYLVCGRLCARAHVHACVHACVCVHACALCACVKREESPDCLETSQNPGPTLCRAPITTIAHWTEPLGEVSGHLGRGEEK